MIGFYKKLEKLTTLPIGWNGHHSIPISKSNAFFASQIAEHLHRLIDDIPQIIPGSNGNLQLEIQQSNASVKIHIIRATKIKISVKFDGKIIFEHIFNSSDKIIEWINMTWNHRNVSV